MRCRCPLRFDGMHHLSRQAEVTGAAAVGLAIVLTFALGALVLGVATLRRGGTPNDMTGAPIRCFY